jgi:ParB family chromosome partitioning protein
MGKKNKQKIRYKEPSAGLASMATPTQLSSIRSSLGLEGSTGDLYQIKLEQLIPFAKQARKVFNQDDIDALAETIKEHGIRQPLTVIKSAAEEGKYEVISGERRLRAATQLRFSKVPCIVLQDASKANEIALIENLHRSDLHPIESAEAYQALITSGLCATQQDIAEKLSITKSIVSETLKLNNLPDEIKTYILSHNIKSRDMFRKLLAAESSDQMKSILKISNAPSKAASMKSASILRITLSEGQYKIQKKAMSVLNAEQKQLLKAKLLEIVQQLS